MLWALILLSLGGLALGPALVAASRINRVTHAAIDGFTIGAVPLLVIVRLMPHAFDEIGVAAIAWAAIGFAVVALAHRGGEKLETRIGQAVVFPTLALHALADGAALALSASAKDRAAGTVLAVAIVMHRLPEGLFVASTSVPVLGWRRTLLRLAVLGAATVAGASVGHGLLEVVPDAVFEGLVAFGLGAMLRMVVHQHHSDPLDGRARAASGIAFVVGVVLALGVPAPRSVLSRAQSLELSMAQFVGPLFVELAPVLLAGVVIAVLLQAISRRVPQSGGVARGLLAAATRSFDSARPAPLARAMLESSDPAFGIAFALALPAIALEALPLSLRLVSGVTAIARLLAALVIVAVAASFAARVAMRGSSFASFGAAEPESLPERGGLVLVVGVVVAAIGEAAIAPGALSRVPPTLAVAIAVAVAVPLGVPLLAAIPIAAVASHKGLAPSAVLAFLVAAPSSDRGVHQAILEACGARAAVVSRVVVIVGALLVGLVPVASDGPAMHPLVAHVHHPIELACAAIVGALLIVSIVRRGARGWLGGDDEHAHALT